VRGRIHKATAPGRFVAGHAKKELWVRRELVLQGATRDTTRLDDVSARASAWLEGEV
jgi:hypothetical protein